MRCEFDPLGHGVESERRQPVARGPQTQTGFHADPVALRQHVTTHESCRSSHHPVCCLHRRTHGSHSRTETCPIPPVTAFENGPRPVWKSRKPQSGIGLENKFEPRLANCIKDARHGLRLDASVCIHKQGLGIRFEPKARIEPFFQRGCCKPEIPGERFAPRCRQKKQSCVEPELSPVLHEPERIPAHVGFINTPVIPGRGKQYAVFHESDGSFMKTSA